MKKPNDDSHPLPASAVRAFEKYPQIAASPDFNRRVLERVLAVRAPSRLELFCDRLDEIFARPILKVLSAAFLGGVLALLGSGALLVACGQNTSASPREEPHYAANAPETALADAWLLQNRLAWARGGEFSAPLPPQYSEPRATTSAKPEQRSSSCPVAFRSLV